MKTPDITPKKRLLRFYVLLAVVAALHVYTSLSHASGAASHSIAVTLDVKARTIRGVDRITVKDGVKALRLYMRNGSDVEKAEAGGRPVVFKIKDAGGGLKELSFIMPHGQKELTIAFGGVFPDTAAAQKDVKRGVAHLKDGVVGEDGAILPSGSFWYPQEKEGLPFFDLTVTMPSGFRSVSEGFLRLASADEKKGAYTESWTIDHPCDGIDLIAGRYEVEREDYKGIALYTYFYKKDEALSKIYINKTKEYLDLYEGLIGPYPFKKFAVVEGFMPTGYGMPSFTLFGSAVLRLPFIPETSLGHEIAHNWWGNSVFVDDSGGNWVEAITTFSADYLYALKKGEDEGRAFRRDKLAGYRNFSSKAGTPLSRFNDATEPAERAVGYNKGLFVFEMLKREIGDTAFDAGFKGFYGANRWRRASWKDVRAAFEAASGRDMKRFFGQWLERAGGPVLSLEDARYEPAPQEAHPYAVRFTLKQEGEPYALHLKAVIEGTGNDRAEHVIMVEKASTEVSVGVSFMPVSMEIDPGYEVFRLLSGEETPASFASFLGFRGGAVVVPEAHKDKYLEAAGVLQKDFGHEIILDTGPNALDYLEKGAIFIFGGAGENRLWGAPLEEAMRREGLGVKDGSFTANGRTYPIKDAVAAFAVKNPADPSKTVCAVVADSGKEGITAAVKRLKYFSDYGFVVFSKDGAIEKGKFIAGNALRREF